jgi:2-methylcitrate dehydratase
MRGEMARAVISTAPFVSILAHPGKPILAGGGALMRFVPIRALFACARPNSVSVAIEHEAEESLQCNKVEFATATCSRVPTKHRLPVALEDSLPAQFITYRTRNSVQSNGATAEVINAVSNAWIDGHPLRVYRQAPNAGSRKGWAAAHASSRAVTLGLMAVKGEMGYPSALSAKTWGFYDVLFGGEPFKISRPYGSYIMENVLFKIAYPAGFHAQSAVECAIQLHPLVRDRLSDIERIELDTHLACIGVLAKTGPLYNFADRDHCLQYMVAIGLLRGTLESSDYEDTAAADPRIDRLRELMVVHEDKSYTSDFYDPDKRSNANAITVVFKDGSKTPKVRVDFPLGHPRRREEGIPLLLQKFKVNLARRYPAKQQAAIFDLCMNRKRLESTPVHEFVDLLAV